MTVMLTVRKASSVTQTLEIAPVSRATKEGIAANAVLAISTFPTVSAASVTRKAPILYSAETVTANVLKMASAHAEYDRFHFSSFWRIPDMHWLRL